MQNEPHIVKCLNCEWFDVAKNLADANDKGETHNIKHHYGKFRWETLTLKELNYPEEFFLQTPNFKDVPMTHKQRHRFFQQLKPYVALQFAKVTIPA